MQPVKKAQTLLRRMAEKAGLQIEGSGHLRVPDSSGNLVTTIPHSPHAKPLTEAIAKKIMEAAGF